MAKKESPEEHENHERWLVSYADFMTLLFAFFVVMYSTSRIDQKRMVDVVKSIKFAMHFKGTGVAAEQLPIFDSQATEGGCVAGLGDQPPTQQAVAAVEAVRRKIEKRLKGILLERPDSPPTVLMHTEGRKLMIRLSASRFFDPAQAAIRPEVIPVLDAIAIELEQFHRPIRVEGHTDDQTTARSRFRDNWDLSASRAASVASYMQAAHQFDGKMLSAAGRGSAWPIADNSTALGRETNRRVELVVEVKPEDAIEAIAR
jgi:chemotaxis protein MotB